MKLACVAHVMYNSGHLVDEQENIAVKTLGGFGKIANGAHAENPVDFLALHHRVEAVWSHIAGDDLGTISTETNLKDAMREWRCVSGCDVSRVSGEEAADEHDSEKEERREGKVPSNIWAKYDML